MKQHKIIGIDSIHYVQFSLQHENGEIYYYRRNSQFEDWEQLCGVSWETLYDNNELEEMYQNWKPTQYFYTHGSGH